MTEKKGFRTRDLVLIAIFAAMMAVCAWISVPVLAVPFTLQSFGVFMALLCLGGKRGTAAICVYVLLGAVGAPVFSGFNGGIGAIMGATGGYIIGFIFSGTQLLAHLRSLPAQGYVPYGACVFGCALRVLPFRHLLVHDGVHGCRQ